MLIYLIKLSVSLSIVWLFYQLVLRRLTFYNSNRWYLLLYTAASFLIPFIDISVLLQKNDLSGAGMVELIPAMDNYAGFTAQQQAPALATRESAMPWWMVVFLAGALLVFIRLVIQLFSMYRLRSKASLLINEEIKLYQVNEAIAPFSFGNAIFINRQLHDSEELKKIIRHEFVHVRQRHSFDVLWGEILCMLNWYNPFAWLIRHSIRQNLEFIADNQVLGSGVDKKQYQYLLLKVTGGAQFHIASQFNFSSLKKRIVMMNKVRTAKVHLLRFFFVLPLAAVLLLAFRSSMAQNSSDAAPQQRQEPAFIADTTQPMGFDEFKKRNPSIQSVSWRSEPHRMIVRLKNGVEEVYNLDVAAEKNRAIQKYGAIPIAPPPPPPPPGSGIGHVISISNSGDLASEHKVFFTRNPSVKTLQWIDGHMLEIHSTSNGVETYDLNNKSDKEKVEKKYGKLPVTPAGLEAPHAPHAPEPPHAMKAQVPPAPHAEEPPHAEVPHNEECVPDPPAPPAPVQVISFAADEITFGNGLIELKGDAQVKHEAGGEITEIKNAALTWRQTGPVMMIDGQEAQQGKKYSGRFEVKNLSGEEAVKKYGEKGRNGVVEMKKAER